MRSRGAPVRWPSRTPWRAEAGGHAHLPQGRRRVCAASAGGVRLLALSRVPQGVPGPMGRGGPHTLGGGLGAASFPVGCGAALRLLDPGRVRRRGRAHGLLRGEQSGPREPVALHAPALPLRRARGLSVLRPQRAERPAPLARVPKRPPAFEERLWPVCARGGERPGTPAGGLERRRPDPRQLGPDPAGRGTDLLRHRGGPGLGPPHHPHGVLLRGPRRAGDPDQGPADRSGEGGRGGPFPLRRGRELAHRARVRRRAPGRRGGGPGLHAGGLRAVPQRSEPSGPPQDRRG